MKNILSRIEEAALRFPAQTAIADGETELTYQELILWAKRIGSMAAPICGPRRPIAIYLPKTPACGAAMLGVLYSGNFYTVLDTQMPAERINRIFETLQPAAVLTDEEHSAAAREFCGEIPILLKESAEKAEIYPEVLAKIRGEMTAEDPMYVLYTSGSTGRPKGVVVSHRAVLAYTYWAINTFEFDSKTVFGSQTPFYFSMSVTDFYSALQTGARLQIIPPKLFSFPLPLIEYLDRWQINTIYWVPSAMGILSKWDAFSYAQPKTLRKILFAGERMPMKCLNYWKRFFPDLFYANLFGPTETTDICTYYIVDRSFEDSDSLPIGRPCDNCRAVILDENGKEAERGELMIGGPFLASGYYRDPEKTAEAFIRSPLNNEWPEMLYCTGDIVERGASGEILYLGRKDYQVKHLGYRIELGEIETAAGAADGVEECACLYDEKSDKLILFYQGETETGVLKAKLKSAVPDYMLPGRLVRLPAMPHNSSGKIDRVGLKANI